MDTGKEVFEIALSDIMPNRFQPREIFDENALNELAESIKTHGVIQPIIVRKIGDKFEIIAGERRFRASQIAGKTTIPAIVNNLNDKETAKIALLENLQREDLTPIEEAKTYQTILKLENKTQEELARDLGKSQSTIANKIRLLNLDESVQTALLNSKISERHARSLLNLEDKTKQREMLNRILLERMTVKQLDEEISRLLGKKIETDGESEVELEDNINAALEQEETPIVNSTNVVVPEVNETNSPMFGLPQINEVVKEEPKPTPQTAPKPEPVPVVEEKIPERPFNIFEQLRKDSNPSLYEVSDGINALKKTVEKLSEKGISITSEEFDFENIYQMVIKIDKNK